MPNPKPPLFASLDILLDPVGIARYLRLKGSDWRLYRQLIPGGTSGATIERVTVRAGDLTAAPAGQEGQASLILKQMEPARDWVMRATDDTRCREVLFTQSPLWEQLPPEVWSPIVGCALVDQKRGKGALLMQDVLPSILPASRCYAPPDFPLAARILDKLAAMHATFWGDPTLRQIAWLATPTDSLLALTPEYLSPLPSDASLYVPEARAAWEHLWDLLDPEDAGPIRQTLAHPASLLQAVTKAPATLVHGNPWLANLGERNGRLMLLDWGFVTAGPATFDSLWLAVTWREMDADRILADHRSMLVQRGVNAVRDDATWELLCGLGWVRATLMGVESLVRDVTDPHSVVPREDALARLRHWCHRTALILRGWGW